ncbi:hypothetical protein Avbf_06293 [Armadillidium vulgare]|nr:hypothetical protein Avbf_06293 [Armadillidium vulgare]
MDIMYCLRKPERIIYNKCCPRNQENHSKCFVTKEYCGLHGCKFSSNGMWRILTSNPILRHETLLLEERDVIITFTIAQSS